MAITSASFRNIARRYVTALFSLAEKQDATEMVADNLDFVANAAANSPEFFRFINNPLVSRQQHENALDALLQKAGAHALTIQFFRELAAARRLPLLIEIAQQFRTLLSEKRGEVTAEVTSAQALGKQQQQEITKTLSQSTGKAVNLELKEDNRILGGLVVKIGGKMLDTSISGKLARIQHAMRAKISQS